MSENCCAPVQQSQRLCPSCGQKGKGVSLLTLNAQLLPQALGRLAQEAAAYFCSTPTCPCVYFNARQTFQSADLHQRVFQKDPSPQTLACYCLELSRANFQQQGPELQQQILSLTQAGGCDCERKNPQGSCCLGNIAKLLKTRAEKI
ncbi:(2Fe-2S)-binding protein [bacterium (Candidatus Blackallbacteria) CG17_big_fil_post_rev_8_21_14_2_50_48_46]|uniref:(2Fe-2S)-binding protein n=1 Tax=bacterium (Candidatus Blackallbacteria) CG17_big_fil_post_rev_8_21_14_2_50_48_46 TaxID=2014261 RepID=A0A2M7G0Y0_9BACT|nr:MAG: (2Fe-2S)-binding protein [bacterium (Candidatus Blackallbacteria) CG18_big_fil_WC_8_21_14_2_50_49_26]PIW15368.1 MAG: (2Fe-2S)-binding protein [bacterium (Candidatus Blackallbacteria) CG17_big_fil_post_rev_8_21_14_2_50_48_46]PIW49771.1 MAG: (2Fe-2S)-binding protein [bacterium (Candidatus Blackallbacteria) CG13_big_fil_rev_8_21_14_2_50_49_14]